MNRSIKDSSIEIYKDRLSYLKNYKETYGGSVLSAAKLERNFIEKYKQERG